MCGGGWFPLSPHCLIQLQTLRMVGGVKISQSVKPPLSLWVPARFYAWRWRLSARPRIEWAWKHICSLVGCSIVVWRRELVPPPEIKLGPWSLFSCWCWSNLPHVTRKHLNIFIWIKLCITRSLCCSQIIMLICMCLSHSDFCVSVSVCAFRSSYVLLLFNSLTDVQTLRRWWVFSGHILAAYVGSVYFKELFEKLLKLAGCSGADDECVRVYLLYVYLVFQTVREKKSTLN